MIFIKPSGQASMVFLCTKMDIHFSGCIKTHLFNLKHVIAYEKTDSSIVQLSNSDKIPVSG